MYSRVSPLEGRSSCDLLAYEEAHIPPDFLQVSAPVSGLLCVFFSDPSPVLTLPHSSTPDTPHLLGYGLSILTEGMTARTFFLPHSNIQLSTY